MAQNDKRIGGGTLEIKVITGDIAQIEADAIVVNLFEDTTQPGGATAAVDKALGGPLVPSSIEVRLRASLEKLTLSILLESPGKSGQR